MKLFGGVDTAALKQHFGKKIMELEDEKRAVQVENNSTNFYSLFFKSKRVICPLFSISSFDFSKRGTVCWLKLKIFLLVLMGKNCKISIPRN